MISIGSRAALSLTLVAVLSGCDQGGRDDSAELGDGPSTLDGNDDPDEDSSDTSESGDSSDGETSDDETTDGDESDSSETDGTSSDTGETGDGPCPDGMTVSIVADFYDAGDGHLAERVFDECLSIATFGSADGFSVTAEFADDIGLFISLPETTSVGDSPVAGDGDVAFNLDVNSDVPAGWVGDYWLVAGNISVVAIGFGANDIVSFVFTGTLYGPGDAYFVDVTITADVFVQYE